MSVVDVVTGRKEIPAIVRFERVPVEDKAASIREGRYVGKDVDFVYITPPYSKDEIPKKVTSWIDQMRQQVQTQRLPQAWMDRYVAEYEAWKNGQELPLEGTPIKGWGVISPAQQEALIRSKVMTVEMLAKITDEGIKLVGMGTFELKNKAIAWLAQLQDKGPLTQEVATLKTDNAVLKGSIEHLEQKVLNLMETIKRYSGGGTDPRFMEVIKEQYGDSSPMQISAADILPEIESASPSILASPKRGPGNPNWIKKAKEAKP